MSVIVARQALTADGWRENVAVRLDGERIAAVEPAQGPATVDILLPAPGNLHSHAFQRAMAGLTETRAGSDDFWSWRSLMYRFLEALDPDDVEIIAAGVQMEMLEAGYAAVGEFHYLHNRPDGGPYDNVAEMSQRIVAAAQATGIGLTLLPVIYMTGGLDGRPLAGGQRRFECDADRYWQLHAGTAAALASLGGDARIGMAPHSLRAVPADELAAVAGFDGPRHIHVAEQTGEVDEVLAHTGRRPIEFLMDTVPLDGGWTLIHATHGTAEELAAVAAAGTTAGLCPITESNLGDGIFGAVEFLAAGGSFGVGSDSNVRIGLCEELRTLDYSQRLSRRGRNPLSAAGRSSGRVLWQGAAEGSARSLGRDAGAIVPGKLADLIALDGSATSLEGLAGDLLLDAHIFAGDDRAVRDVWSAGRHVVREGRHIARDTIGPAFQERLRRLRTHA